MDRMEYIRPCFDKRHYEGSWNAGDYYYARRGYISGDRRNGNRQVLPHTFAREGIAAAPSYNSPELPGQS